MLGLFSLTVLPAGPAAAATLPNIPEQGLLCRAAIRQAESGRAIPPLLLSAIGRVESGRSDPVTHRVHPWPWSINAEGRSYVFETKADAIKRAHELQASGTNSFDVGCMQVNLMYHPQAFRDLEEAFDPLANARYAASFLSGLKDSTGSWEQASAAYHSATPELGRSYRALVESALTQEAKSNDGFAGLSPIGPGAGSFPTSVPSALRSLPSGVGNSMVMGGHFGGSVIPLPRITAPSLGGGGTLFASTTPGRGLDDYRARPVALAASPSLQMR